METLKLLVIDDEPGIRSGVLRILKNYQVSYPFMDEDFHFTVFEAATGEEGIEIITSKKPDIVLLDNKLPGIQGIDVLEFIKENQIDTCVAMITSYASLEIAVKATGDGAFDFIPKPFTPQELKSSIDHIAKQLFLKRVTRNLKKEGKKIRFQFLSVLSHELKAPLNAIEGYLKIMQQKQAGDHIDDYNFMIEQSINRIQGMNNLIMNLLDFTKISQEKRNKKNKDVNLVKLAKLAISTIQPYAIQKNISIEFTSDEKITLAADPEDMEIIFNNLLSNAVKYNKEQGSIHIDISNTGTHVDITIVDTGIGMSMNEQSLIFKEFSRVKNSKTKHIAGSGLGLSIVKRVVSMYSGKIEVKSIPDEGTTFKITFPIKI